MKVLVLNSVANDAPDNRISAVDLWRTYRPWKELAKHVDWQIDHAQTAIKEVEKFKSSDEFTKEELEQSAEWLGQYDIIHSSYFTNAAQFALLMTVQKLYGTKFVLDVDDDMFSVNPDNPFWMRATHDDVFNMQQMIKNVDFVTTTTEKLAYEIRKRRTQPAETVMVVPNYLPKVYKEGKPDNKDVVIGYFGGASHYRDLHETGCIEAVERIMHKHKNVRFHSVGMIVDKYIPKGRYTFTDGKKGNLWAKELFPALKFDIALAPLEDTIFARSKSSIKWMESTRMGAAVIASYVGPYKELKHGELAELVKNDIESWEYALDELITNETKRKEYVKRARKSLKENHMLEDHWQVLQKAMEKVHKTPPADKRLIVTE